MSEAEEKRYKLVYRVLGQVPYRCVVSSFEYAGFTKYVEEDEEEETTEGVWNIMWGIGNKSTLKHMNKY
jgi:tubulin polyglutamylase TTLL4